MLDLQKLRWNLRLAGCAAMATFACASTAYASPAIHALAVHEQPKSSRPATGHVVAHKTPKPAVTASVSSLGSTIPALPSEAVVPLNALFATDSVWNTPVPANAPLDPSSSQLAGSLATEAAREYALNTGPWIATKGSGTIYNVGPDQPTVSVQLDNPTEWWRTALQSAFEAVPVPADAQTPYGSDAEMTILQPSTDKLWEFFHMRLEADGWHAAWGGAIDNVSGSPGYYTTNSWSGALAAWGATATSLPVVAGEVTLSEIQQGVINHALALDVPAARANTFAWPAERTDGKGGPATFPEGAHLMLDPNLALNSLNLSPFALMLARAAQKYGMIVRDQTGNGLSFYVQDPTPAGMNPFYTNGNPSKSGPFQGKWPQQILRTFPWSSVHVLQMSLQSTQSAKKSAH